MQSTINDDFIIVEKGVRAWGYFAALVSLPKDLSVCDHPGHIV
jgi:hypothetical protein